MLPRSILIVLTALAAALVLPAHGAPPSKTSLTSYQRLWMTSPFTVKPPPPEPDDVGPGPLEDFTLASVSQTQDGWFVVLMNKKEREKRVRIVPGTTGTEGFKVLDVKQDPASYKSTKVQLAYQGDTGWLGYEDKYLALKSAAAAAPARPAAPRQTTTRRPTPPRPNPTANRATATPTPPGTRQPRIRRVPTPPQR